MFRNLINIFRSIVFNIFFFSDMTLFMLFGIFLIPGSSKCIYRFWHYFSLSVDFLVRNIAGITYTIEYLEDHKPDKEQNSSDNSNGINKRPTIYAVRHESTWETLVLVHYFEEPIFLIKKELANIPIFGTLAKKAGAIPIDREEGVKALMDSLKNVQKGISAGHPIIMFPEGTRVHTGEYVELKRGIALFYASANCPVVPVVHNSGLFWSRRSFIKTPGNITVKIFPPIEPGLSKNEFMSKLNEVFHEGVNELKLIEEKRQ